MSEAYFKMRISGPAENREIEGTLKPTQVFTIGRKDCNLNINDARISRRHVSLSVETGELVADDLGSHNGTVFNGEKLATKSLTVGDTFEVGDHRLELLAYTAGKITMERLKKDLGREEELPRFTFFPEEGLSWEPIWQTYVGAAKNWRNFWQEVSCSIPLDHSLVVLSILSVGYGLIAGIARGGLNAVTIAFLLAMSTLGFSIIVSAVISTLRSLLMVQGRFDQYLAFQTYVVFFSFPIIILSKITGGLGSLFGLVVMAWSIRGFFLKFQPDKKRFTLFLIAAVLLSLLVFGGAAMFMARMLSQVASEAS